MNALTILTAFVALAFGEASNLRRQLESAMPNHGSPDKFDKSYGMVILVCILIAAFCALCGCAWERRCKTIKAAKRAAASNKV